jgi:hypothetical protein
VRDTLLQDAIGRQPDGVANAFGLQEFVKFGLGEDGVGAEVVVDAFVAITDDHRLQQRLPVLGAVRITGTNKAALEVAELIAQEQWVITSAAEVPVAGGALLTAVGRAHRAIYVENDAVRWLSVVDTVDPCAAETGESAGLDLVEALAQQLGGALQLEAAGGTRLVVIFPRTSAAAAA